MKSLILAISLALASISVSAQPAECQQGCLPSFCGSSAECPSGCFCAIGMGKATGRCAGSR